MLRIPGTTLTGYVAHPRSGNISPRVILGISYSLAVQRLWLLYVFG